jgi:hypothetical protein
LRRKLKEAMIRYQTHNSIAPAEWAKFFWRALAALFLGAGLFGMVGCGDQIKRRPYGFLKVGPVKDFLQPETYRADLRMLFRRDDRGLSVMSTLCTYDLSPLVLVRRPDGSDIFVSQYSESRYTKTGAVIQGPAKGNLPFYKMRLAEEVIGGAVDTLYIEIGAETSSEWRLPIEVKATAQR